MKRIGACLVILVAVAIPVYASYTTATNQFAPESDGFGRWRATIRFTGNAGEEPVDFTYLIQPNHTAADVQYWVQERLNELNAARGTARGGRFGAGATITPANRPTDLMGVCKLRARQVDRGDRINTAAANAYAARLAVARTALDNALAALVNQAERDECLTTY